MAINRSAIRDLLLPGLRGIEGDYETIPTQHTKVYETMSSDMALERWAEVRLLPPARLKDEGANISFDNESGQRNVYNLEPRVVALGYAITEEAMEDNLYKGQFQATQMGMNDSFAETKEIFGADLFNTGTTYNPAIGGDGVALFSASHPIDAGTLANRPSTDVSLNEAGIESSLTRIRGWKGISGIKASIRGRKLVVSANQEWIAHRLMKTELRVGTANNDVSAIVNSNALPDGYMVWDYLTSSYAWFILTSKKGLVFMKRAAYKTNMFNDDYTNNLLVTGRERYGFGYRNWRAVHGSFPSA